ncbi:hypothetical protein ABZ863_30865 [Saccharomonospora sp. NPDC046836]|uniref:hypothetical protein n=1 Tax=Saccharomonospora sp. NPDC046836 TaxID=3156921 RepID=UPI0033CBFD02
MYLALGIHGQLLFVDETAGVVIAKFSSWPGTWHDDLAQTTLRACRRIAATLAQR